VSFTQVMNDVVTQLKALDPRILSREQRKLLQNLDETLKKFVASQTPFYVGSVTVEEVIRAVRPEALEKWDRWSYKICPPISLDDSSYLRVVLTNKDGSYMTVILNLLGAQVALENRKKGVADVPAIS